MTDPEREESHDFSRVEDVNVPVRYYCPQCGTVATLQRDAYLADKSVTPYPLEGWTYADPEEEFEDADGVCLTCGEHRESGTDGAKEPCGEQFYLNFVRFEGGEEVETVPESEHVRLGVGPRADGPRVPDDTGGS
ncbi:MAG: hypothetical protein ABEH88_12575 [Halobacteriales archaeon]